MTRYEYTVVPAPTRTEKQRGLKTSEERFAHTLGAAINAMAVKGWQFQRSETMTFEEKRGFFSRKTTATQTLLIFCRPVSDASETMPRQAAVRDEATQAAGGEEHVATPGPRDALSGDPADAPDAGSVAPRPGAAPALGPAARGRTPAKVVAPIFPGPRTGKE